VEYIQRLLLKEMPWLMVQHSTKEHTLALDHELDVIRWAQYHLPAELASVMMICWMMLFWVRNYWEGISTIFHQNIIPHLWVRTVLRSRNSGLAGQPYKLITIGDELHFNKKTGACQRTGLEERTGCSDRILHPGRRDLTIPWSHAAFVGNRLFSMG